MRKNYTKKRPLKEKYKTRRKRGGNSLLQVKYHNKSVNGHHLTREETQQQPSVIFPETNRYYTLIMYDTTVPWLHWLVINLKNSQEIINTNDKIIMPYAPPTPPLGIHTYHFELLEHNEPIKLSNIQKYKNNSMRRNFKRINLNSIHTFQIKSHLTFTV